MKKRLCSLLLSLALVLPLCPAALASPLPVDAEEAAQVLAALDIMTGDENGRLYLERLVTRAEFTKLTLAASTYRSSVGSQASVAPYPDVPKALWYAPWIQAARDNGLVRGDLYGLFAPERTITLAEGVTMVLRLLGYQDSDFAGAWPTGQMALYADLGLDKGVSAGTYDPLSRQDSLYLFYNLLTARMKDGRTVYLTTLGGSLTPDGEIDLVALINSAMEGPLVLDGEALAAIPFDLSSAHIYRNGQASALSRLQRLDVLYYSKSMHTLWAWSDKVSGVIQSITPSPAAPSAIVVGGKSYPLSGSEAIYALSHLGSFRVGDTVTLLLGRKGECVALRSPADAAQALVGVVTAVGVSSQPSEGGSYMANSVFLTAADGGSYVFPWEDKYVTFSPGDLAECLPTDSGFSLRRLSGPSLEGTVNSAGTALGEYPFASDVQILDVWDVSALRIYPQRLAGVRLEGEDVAHFSLNEAGEICRLILRNVTGDLFSYGVLTDVKETASGLSIFSSYVYDLSGVRGSYTSQTLSWSLCTGPCQVRSSGGQIKRIYNLSQVSLTAVGETRADSPQGSFPLSDGLVVYELRSGSYYLSSLERVRGSGASLTGWYDSLPAEGGALRVIVAQTG